MVNNKFNKNFE